MLLTLVSPGWSNSNLYTHLWPFSKSKFNLKSERVNLLALVSPIECLLYLPNVRVIQYKLGPERLTQLGNLNVQLLPVTIYFVTTLLKRHTSIYFVTTLLKRRISIYFLTTMLKRRISIYFTTMLQKKCISINFVTTLLKRRISIYFLTTLLKRRISIHFVTTLLKRRISIYFVTTLL